MATPRRPRTEPKAAPNRLPVLKPEKDFFDICNDGEVRMEDANLFIQTYCQRCRNPECKRAQHGNPWVHRMQTQVDYLLDNPKFSGLDSEEHQKWAAMLFEDRLRHAERLEIARAHQDWVPPPQKRVFLPVLFNPPPEPAAEPTPIEAPKSAAAPSLASPAPVTPSPPLVSLPTPKSPPRYVVNTYMPPAGVMVDGTVASNPPPPKEEIDPWTPTTKKETVVVPGAKIVLK